MSIDEAKQIYEEFVNQVADQGEFSWRETAWRDVVTGEEGVKFSVIQKNLIVKLVETIKKGQSVVKFQYWFAKKPENKTDVTSLEQLLNLL